MPIRSQPVTIARSRKEPLSIVRKIVKSHRENNPTADIRMALWLNPTEDLLRMWKDGIRLLEISGNLPIDREADFRPTYFSARLGTPPMELVLTSVGELNYCKEMRHPYVRSLERSLRACRTRVVFPTLKRDEDAFDAYDSLLLG